MTTNAQVAERIANNMADRAGNMVDAAAAAATNIFEAASNILTEAVSKYGQSVVDTVLWVVRIDALQQLVSAWIAMGLVFALGYFLVLKFTKGGWINFMKMNRGEPVLVSTLTAATYVVLFGLVFFPRYSVVTNIWLYTAVAKPELYLAKQAVDIVKDRLTLTTSNPAR